MPIVRDTNLYPASLDQQIIESKLGGGDSSLSIIRHSSH